MSSLARVGLAHLWIARRSITGTHPVGAGALGAGLAVLSALLYDIGFVLEKQGLAGVPEVRLHPVSIVRTASRSKRWLAGFAAMLFGLALQVVALTLAPVSVVQPILACGLLGLAAIGPWLLDEQLERRDVVALGSVLLAAVAIAVSTRVTTPLASEAPGGRFALLSVPVAIAAVLLVRSRSRSLVNLALGAGLLYGLGAVSEKAVATHLVSRGLLKGTLAAMATPYPWLFVAATLAGMVMFQVGLQSNPASLMASLTNVVSTACALAGASIVFSERLLPAGWWMLARLAGFGGILAAVAILLQGSSETRAHYEGASLPPPADVSSPRSVRAPS
jgi:multidrug transporter EmrE-like cation transporter